MLLRSDASSDFVYSYIPYNPHNTIARPKRTRKTKLFYRLVTVPDGFRRPPPPIVDDVPEIVLLVVFPVVGRAPLTTGNKKPTPWYHKSVRQRP
jgi:hypothetical protein